MPDMDIKIPHASNGSAPFPVKDGIFAKGKKTFNLVKKEARYKQIEEEQRQDKHVLQGNSYFVRETFEPIES